MATLAELSTIYGRGEAASQILFDKVKAAVMIAAETIRLESDVTTNHANRAKWAKRAWSSPTEVAQDLWAALLAGVQVGTPTVTVAQITGAADASIQTAVNNTINIFADGV
jgi:hypothetical protein